MGRCDVRGNDYQKTMVITGRYFCCARCTQMAGVPERRVNV